MVFVLPTFMMTAEGILAEQLSASTVLPLARSDFYCHKLLVVPSLPVVVVGRDTPASRRLGISKTVFGCRTRAVSDAKSVSLTLDGERDSLYAYAAVDKYIARI
ncbi:hypothetical protein LX36DRAFT_58570 [Colletotrichum falcatum]|nr:hypothetical protein LX36DRAFT_58570 [Colletotrichum falcatum]